MVATIASVTPNLGPHAGGTVLTIVGTGFLNCQNQVLFQVQGQSGFSAAVPTSQTDTQIVVAAPAHGGVDALVDIGVSDTVASVVVWSVGAFYYGPVRPYNGPQGQWDQTKWDGASWQTRWWQPGAGWHYDWQVWYQYGGAVVWDMTQNVVEVRWTTDTHTPGDGTYRGDIQPGAFQLQLHDPNHQADTLEKLGTIWLHYAPSNFTWGYYLETVTRQLVSPTDATAADCVLTGTTWPLRLTTDNLDSGWARPAERVDTRFAAIVAKLNGNATLAVPAYTSTVETQAETVAAVAPVSWSAAVYPSVLSQLRQCAANGIAWLSAGVNAGVGGFTLHYSRWETVGALYKLAQSDLVAGVASDQSINDLVTRVTWNWTDQNNVSTQVDQTDPQMAKYGQAAFSMRVFSTTVLMAGITQTGSALLAARANPELRSLSTITATSGVRTHPDGTPGPAWNPASHVFGPLDRVQWWITSEAGYTWQTLYWVTQTAHRLRAAGWDSAHTVVPWAPAYGI